MISYLKCRMLYKITIAFFLLTFTLSRRRLEPSFIFANFTHEFSFYNFFYSQFMIFTAVSVVRIKFTCDGCICLLDWHIS